MYYWDLARYFTRYFRRRRQRSFAYLFPPQRYQHILDVGGSAEFWEAMDYPAEITLLNINEHWFRLPATSARSYKTVVADGRNTGYPDGSFDLAFSNSVIEHVGNPQDAAQFAREMQRVAKAFYCQTPNKWFPVEPHVGTVFLHWFPGLLERYFVFRYFTLWGLMHKPDRQTAWTAARDARLLTKRELQRIFPGAEILTERVLFLPKSYIAIRRPRIDAPHPLPWGSRSEDKGYARDTNH